MKPKSFCLLTERWQSANRYLARLPSINRRSGDVPLIYLLEGSSSPSSTNKDRLTAINDGVLGIHPAMLEVHCDSYKANHVTQILETCIIWYHCWGMWYYCPQRAYNMKTETPSYWTLDKILWMESPNKQTGCCKVHTASKPSSMSNRCHPLLWWRK